MTVFISHHSSKADIANHVVEYLERHDHKCWIAPRDITPGTVWDEEILAGLATSHAMVLLFCKAADNSRHIKREVLLADQANLPIFPLQIEDVVPEKLQYFLKTYQWIEWLDRRDSALDTLASALVLQTSSKSKPYKKWGYVGAAIVAFLFVAGIYWQSNLPGSLPNLTLSKAPITSKTFKGHTKPVNSAVFSPDGKSIVTASEDGTAKIWDTNTEQIKVTLNGHAGSVNSAAFSPDGKYIVTAYPRDLAKIWDAITGQEVTILNEHTSTVSSAAFSPDGKSVVTASWDGTAKIWDAKTGQTKITLNGYAGIINSAAFSPDGKYIVTAGSIVTRIWDAKTGKIITALNGHTDVVNSAAFSPDGKSIITASADGTAKIWDAKTGQIKTTLESSEYVNSAAFSPDGKYIVTAGWVAEIWDAKTGQIKTTLNEPLSTVLSAAFSPDGKSIVTASWDGTAKIWDVEKELAAISK